MQKQMTDLDLPIAYRTQANLWEKRYFEMYKELVNANKGIRRLKRKLTCCQKYNQSLKSEK